MNEKSVVFHGIDPKPPPSPSWGYLLKNSTDYGRWQSSDTSQSGKKKKKNRRKKYGND